MKVVSMLITVVLFLGSLVYVQKPYHDNASLQERYEKDNNNYFDGNLPNIPVVWADIPMDGKSYVMAQTTQDIYGNSEMIEIDTKTNITEVTRDLSLIHEECHVATGIYVRSHDEDPHGMAFQRCMLNLAHAGALNGLW